MRELKFRVWSEEDKEYRTDCNVCKLFNGMTGCPATIYSDEGDRFDIEQYTGLKDKNGKEIYEGDIVERRKLISAREMAVPGWGKDHTEIRRAAVVYEHGMFYGRSITAGIGSDYLQDELETDFEIIGNIHESPELLKEES